MVNSPDIAFHPAADTLNEWASSAQEAATATLRASAIYNQFAIPPDDPEPDYDDVINAPADPVDYADVPAFNAAADATLARAGAVHTQRGGEYGDSWALENLSTTFLDNVLRTLGIFGLSKAEKRLIVIAALIDVKESRMLGEWKLDTVEDGINYRAAFATWREEYKEATGT